MNHLSKRLPGHVIVILLAVILVACGENPDKLIASARDYLSKNDGKAAVIQLKSALQSSPKSPEARFLLGKALILAGDYVGAETELRRALDYKYSANEVVPLLAQAMLGLRQAKKLTDEFGSVELTQPTAQANLKTILASAYAAQGKSDLSQAALDSALAADPKYGPALLTQASQKAGQGDVAGALAVVDSVVSSAPDNYEAFKLRGDLKRVGGRDEAGALADYRKAVEIRPSYAAGHAAILTILLQLGQLDEASNQLEILKKQSPNNYLAHYFGTTLAYQKKDFKLAREQAQQLMKIAPDDVRSLLLAGTIELQGNSTLQAELHLGKALKAAPESLVIRRTLASVYLRSGQPEKALATMQAALKAKDLDEPTNAILGRIYLQSGDSAKAEEYFSKATQADPKNSRNRIALAVTHLAGGKSESGLSELQDIASSDTGPTADLALINAQLRRQDYDKALKAIDSLEKKQPTSPLPANLRGRTLLAKKDLASARKSFERSLQIDPNYFASLASLAALDLMENRPDDARRRFETVLSKDPKNARALLALAELRARAGAPKAELVDLLKRAVGASPTSAEPRLLLVDFQLRQKDFKDAVVEAQSGVAAVPESAELLDALGRAQAASGSTNQAVTTFTKVSAMQPASPLPYMRLSALYLSTNNKDAAIQSLRKALEVKPDFLDAQVGLIALAVDSKNIDEATRIALSVQKQRPKADVGYQLAGDVAASQKKWDGAVRAYQDGLRVAPTSNLAVKLDTVLRASGKSVEAQKFSTVWVAEHSKDVPYRFYLADVALRDKDFSGAEKQYLSIIQLQTTNALVYNNLAWVQGQLKRESAISYAQKAVDLAPKQPAFLDTMASLLSAKNDFATAIEWQQRAVAMQPDSGLFRANLAKIYIKSGQKDLARKELTEVAKLGDKYRGQAEVAELLKIL